MAKKNVWWEVFKLIYLDPIKDFFNELRESPESEEA
jgi:hypothetical protein